MVEELQLVSSDSITGTRVMTVKEIVSLASTKRLNLQPEFQRRRVWPKPAKSYLIDTMIRGLPMPEIFAYTERSGAYAVIDGQQRLSTIIDFANMNLHAWTGGKIITFDDMDSEQRDTFFGYKVVFRIINSWDTFLVKDIFMRLNRYVVPLNYQEMRHAKAEAKIVRLAEELSQDRFWRVSGLSPVRSQVRMKDVEFILRLLLSMKNGPVGGGGLEIDRAVSSLEPSDLAPIEEGYHKTLDLVKKIFGSETFSGKFGGRDFFPFFIGMRSLAGIKITEAEARRIKESVFELKTAAFSKNPTGLALQYFQACYGGGVGNVRTRAEILLQVAKKSLRH